MHITVSGQALGEQLRSDWKWQAIPNSRHIRTSKHPLFASHYPPKSNIQVFSPNKFPSAHHWGWAEDETLPQLRVLLLQGCYLLSRLIFSHVWKWKITISRMPEMSTFQHISQTNFYFWSKAGFGFGPFPQSPNKDRSNTPSISIWPNGSTILSLIATSKHMQQITARTQSNYWG